MLIERVKFPPHSVDTIYAFLRIGDRGVQIIPHIVQGGLYPHKVGCFVQGRNAVLLHRRQGLLHHIRQTCSDMA